jgi:hypothetical protein
VTCKPAVGAVIGTVARVAAALPFDVGRQRHCAVAGEGVAERLALAIEAQDYLALRAFFDHFGGEIGGEFDAVPWVQPARALGVGEPTAAAEIARQRHLDRRQPAPPDQSRRDHLRVIEDEQVSRAQQLRQVGDIPVGGLSLGRHHQEARAVARLGRAVGDQLARQSEIEIGEMHG